MLKAVLMLTMVAAFSAVSRGQAIKDMCKRIDRPVLRDHIWVDNSNPLRFCAQVVPVPKTKDKYVVFLWDAPTPFPMLDGGDMESSAIAFVESNSYITPITQP